METETIDPKTEQRTVALEKVSQTEAELKQLVADYGKFVVTEDNVKEADEVRLKFYRPRIDIQRWEKANKVIIDKLYDENKSRAENLIKLIQPTEKAIEAKILAVKTAIAEKARKAAEAEQKRVTAHQNRLKVGKGVMVMGSTANTEEELVRLKKQLEDNFTAHDFEEFKAESQQIVIDAKKVLSERSEFLDMKRQRDLADKQAADIKAQQQMKLEEKVDEINAHHPHEIGMDTVDTPETVKEFEKAVHPEFTAPFKGTTSGFSRRQEVAPAPPAKFDFDFKSAMVPWSYGGYNFGIDASLDEATRTNIQNCLVEIIDSIPM